MTHPSLYAITRREWGWAGSVSCLILVLATAPTIWGYLATPTGFQFGGLLFNSIDSNTYLAKMMQGVRGEWLFTLPFTAEPGAGSFLLVHYLFLGHLAAWFKLEPILVYHWARIVGGAVMLLTLYHFIAYFCADMRERRFAFLIATVGSGLGWLALFFGSNPPDFWLAEAYPFLSIFANVHFPWAMAAFLWVMEAYLFDQALWIKLSAGTLILALLQPFGLVTIGLAVALWIAWKWWRQHDLSRALITRLSLMSALALPFLIYVIWVTMANPALAAWNQQNVTPSPPVWDYLIAGGLVLALAALGALIALRQPIESIGNSPDCLLLAWVGVTAVLVYLPLNLQRRFAFALFIPLAILAARAWSRIHWRPSQLAQVLFLALISLTNVLLLCAAFITIERRPAQWYFSDAEWNGLMYLRAHAQPHAVVLASPEMGLFIPAWAGQRVIYGHPYETPNADTRRAEVEHFFAGTLSNPSDFLRPIDLIFFGPRERQLGAAQIPPNFVPTFADGDVVIYARQSQ